MYIFTVLILDSNITGFSPYSAVNTLRLGCKKSRLMRCGVIVTVGYEIHIQHVKTLCGQKEFLNVETGGTYSNHWASRS